MVFNLCIIALLLSCNHQKTEHEINQIHSLTVMADSDYYRANLLIDSLQLSNKRMSAECCMRIKLLEIKIADKMSVLDAHKNEGKIDSIISFFKNCQDYEVLAEAFYYKGRIYFEEGRLYDAMVQFELAKGLFPLNINRYSLYSVISSQLSHIYTKLDMPDKAEDERISMLNLAYSTGKQDLILDSELDLAAIYSINKSFLKAHHHLNNLLAKFPTNDTSEFRTCVLIQLAHLNLREEEYEKADSVMNIIAASHKGLDAEAYNFVGANLYLKLGDWKKARYFCREILNKPGLTDKPGAINNLLTIAAETNDRGLIKEIAAYAPEVTELEKKAASLEKSTHIDNIQYLVDTSNKLKNERDEATKSKDCYMVSTFSLGLIIIVMILLFVRYKNRLDKAGAKNVAEEIPLKEESTTDVIEETAPQGEAIELPSEEEEPVPVKKAPIKPSLKIHIIPECEGKQLEIGLINKALRMENPSLKSKDWETIEKEVRVKGSDFIAYLDSMNLSVSEWRVSVLLKAGANPSTIASLMNMSPSNISKMRSSLCARYLDVDKDSANKWDDFIARL